MDRARQTAEHARDVAAPPVGGETITDDPLVGAGETAANGGEAVRAVPAPKAAPAAKATKSTKATKAIKPAAKR